MDAILGLAKRLGQTIAESVQAKALRDARAELDTSPQVVGFLKDYQEQSAKVFQLESENKPVEVDDKHKLDDLRDKLAASDIFKRYTAAQVEYVDLMRQVNESLRRQLTSVEGE